MVGDSGYGGKPDKIIMKQVEHSEDFEGFIEQTCQDMTPVNKRLILRKWFQMEKNQFKDVAL